MTTTVDLSSLALGIPAALPEHPGVTTGGAIPCAPRRKCDLSADETVLALKNALRYFPSHLHEALAPEFAQELKSEGHIYMHRYVWIDPALLRGGGLAHVLVVVV